MLHDTYIPYFVSLIPDSLATDQSCGRLAIEAGVTEKALPALIMLRHLYNFYLIYLKVAGKNRTIWPQMDQGCVRATETEDWHRYLLHSLL